MTYADIEQEALAADAIREYNVIAMGDGENLHDGDTADTYQAPDRWASLWRHTEATRKRNRDNAAQVREWQQERVQVLAGCMGALCSECRMGVKDCEDYQDFLDSEGYGAQQFTTAQGLEIAGAFTPRCDH